MSWYSLEEMVPERVRELNACLAMVKSSFFFSVVQFDTSRALASLQETQVQGKRNKKHWLPIKNLW